MSNKERGDWTTEWYSVELLQYFVMVDTLTLFSLQAIYEFHVCAVLYHAMVMSLAEVETSMMVGSLIESIDNCQ